MIQPVDQRFDSSARLEIHFHQLFTDGAVTRALGEARADFHTAAVLTVHEVTAVTAAAGAGC